MALEAPLTLDPSLAQSVYDSLPVNQIFDGLVDVDPSLGVRPALAETWTRSDDGRTYVFHLRPGVRFHDGRPVTADDVRFTIERVLCPVRDEYSLAAPYLHAIEGAVDFVERRTDHVSGLRVVDERTVEIRLEREYPMFLEVLALDALSIVPGAVVRERGGERFAREPVGTGPFRLQRWADDGLVLQANDEYFGGRPYLDALEVRFHREGDTDGGAARLYSGEIDVLEPPTEEIPKLNASSRWALHRYQELSLSFLGFGTQLPPVDRVEVRQAIAHAIDRSRLVAQSPVIRREATGILPPGMLAYSPDEKALRHDPVRARLLLKRAGYDESHPVPPLTLYMTSASANAERLVASIRSDLEQVGIPLDVRRVPWPRLTELLEAREAPAFLLAWIADMNDPDSFLRGLLDVDGGGNDFGFEDAEAAEILEAGLRELNPAERTRIYRRLERRVLSHAPLVPLYHTLGVVATRREVHGVEPGPMGIANLEFERVWIEPAAVAAFAGDRP
jgi:peptide/nickel transport system substrate-binding protein/oligopeptide transport system substrate-binding protein